MRLKILALCDFDRNSAGTIIDHAMSFGQYSRNRIYYFNPVRRRVPFWLDLSKFDIILIHYSIYTLGDTYLNADWRQAIGSSPAVKVQFIQDEYRRVYAFHERIKELRIGVLFTCLPEQEMNKVYPPERLPGIRKISNLTGYIPEYLARRNVDFRTPRPIDVGYRGRELGYWYGRLAQEKKLIAENFLFYAKNSGLTCDISWREEDRIYGKRWIKFLESCRCILGTESGASVIDFTGEIENTVKRYCLAQPGATFAEVEEIFLSEHENRVKMNQISPRIFEGIACGCCQVLFEGDYSGILTPGVHYISLKKDFSDIGEVIQKIKDKNLVPAIAQRAYRDIIESGRYSYRSFIEFFDQKIEEHACRQKVSSHLPFDGQTASQPMTVSCKGEFTSGNEEKPKKRPPGGGKRNEIRHTDFFYQFIFEGVLPQCRRAFRPPFLPERKVLRKLKKFFMLAAASAKRTYLFHPFFVQEKFKLFFYMLKSRG